MDTRLTVNVDHVATLRNARGGMLPDPVHVAVLALNAGADGIVVHLREDRRHIIERDVAILRATVPYLDLEMALEDEIIEFAHEVRPDLVTLVPEKREELTTEGGLDVKGGGSGLVEVIQKFQENGIPVSLFVDPELARIEEAVAAGAQCVELHTGRYADAETAAEQQAEFEAIVAAAGAAEEAGLRVNAGHGLHLDNVAPIAEIPEIEELSIGHFLIGRAIHVGIEQAVREMREVIRG